MPWWVSVGFFGLAVMLWLSGRRNPDEVIGLLEKLLAALLVVVVLLESRNMLLESLALLAVLQLPATLRQPPPRETRRAAPGRYCPGFL